MKNNLDRFTKELSSQVLTSIVSITEEENKSEEMKEELSISIISIPAEEKKSEEMKEDDLISSNFSARIEINPILVQTSFVQQQNFLVSIRLAISLALNVLHSCMLY